MLKLMRIASSGGLMLRGGDRHNPVEFRARSCFLFSSINTPPLRPQDLSRMAILRSTGCLGQPSPDLDARSLSVVGRCTLRVWRRSGRGSGRRSPPQGRARRRRHGRARPGHVRDAALTCADLIAHAGWSEERLRAATADGDLVP